MSCSCLLSRGQFWRTDPHIEAAAVSRQHPGGVVQILPRWGLGHGGDEDRSAELGLNRRFTGSCAAKYPVDPDAIADRARQRS